MKRVVLHGARWLLLLLGFCLALGGGGALAQSEVVIRINGEEDESGASIQAVLTAYGTPGEVTSLEVRSGEVVAADWQWMQSTGAALLTKLESFVVAPSAGKVADLTTANFPFGTARTVRIAKLAKVGNGALKGAQRLWELELPDVIELGNEALAECAELQLVRIPKATKLGNGIFNGCEELHMLQLPAAPPALVGVLGDDLPSKRYVMFQGEDGSPLPEGGKLHDEAVKAYDNHDGKEDDAWHEWGFANFYPVAVSDGVEHGKVELSPVKPAYLMSRLVYERDRVELICTPEAGYVPAGASITYQLFKSDGTTETTEVTTDELPGGWFLLRGSDAEVSVRFEAPKDLKASIVVDGAAEPVEKSAESLAKIFEDVDLAKVLQVSLTQGAFETEDWTWLKANSGSLTKLTHFGMTRMQYVADMPDLSAGESYFPVDKALLELDLHGVRRIGKGALHGHKTLEVLRAGMLLHIGDEALKDSKKLRFLALGRVPPSAKENSFEGLSKQRVFMLVSETGERLTNSGVPRHQLTEAARRYGVDPDPEKPIAQYWMGWRYGRYSPIEILPSEHGKVLLASSARYGVEGDVIKLIYEPEAGYVKSKAEYLKMDRDGLAVQEVIPIVNDQFEMPNRKVKIRVQFGRDRNLTGTIKEVDGKEVTKTVKSLEELLAGYPGDSRLKVKEMIFTAGEFHEADWDYLKYQTSEEAPGALKGYQKLTRFEITDGVEVVQNMPDLTGGARYFTSFRESLIENLLLAKITRLGRSAFSGVELREAILPEVEEMADNGFLESRQLERVVAPKLKKVGTRVFQDAVSLQEANFPLLEEIGDEAFDHCAKLTKIDFPVATKVGSGAFKQCISLTHVRLPKAEGIGDATFFDEDNSCDRLVQVYAPSVKSIGQKAFKGSKRLRTLVLGAEPPTVDIAAFEECPASRRVLIVQPDGTPLQGEALTQALEKYKKALDENQSDDLWFGWSLPTSQLYNVAIDNSIAHGTLVVDLIPYASEGEEVIVEAKPELGYRVASIYYRVDGGEAKTVENGRFVMPAGNVVVGATFELNAIEILFNGATQVNKGTSIKSAAENAGLELKSVKSINVVGGRMQVADWEWLHEQVVRKQLVSLTQFKIGEGMEFVADMPDLPNTEARGYLYKPLEELVLAKVKRVGDLAIFDTQTLRRASLLAATSIGEYAFARCEALSSLSAPELEEVGDQAFMSTFELAELSLPKLKKVGFQAFDNRYKISLTGSLDPDVKLRQINLPMLEEAGAYSFAGTKLVERIELPSLTRMREGAFEQSNGLVSVSLPKLTVLPEEAFYVCKRLAEIHLPEVVEVGVGAFKNCYALPLVTERELPKLERIGRDAFVQASSLGLVNLPGVTSVGPSAFKRCEALAVVTLPKLTALTDSVFIGCIGLTSANLPLVTSIGRSAFERCNKLEVISLGAVPPTVESKAFEFEVSDPPIERILSLVSPEGVRLEGDALEAAKKAYLESPGGDKTKKTWYGFNLDAVVYNVQLASNVEHGQIAGLPRVAKEGAIIALEPLPEQGYVLKPGTLKVYKVGDPSAVIEVLEGAFTMPAHDVEVYAEFEVGMLYEVAVTDTENGTITVDPRQAPAGLKVNVTLAPKAGMQYTRGTLKVVKTDDNTVFVPIAEPTPHGDNLQASFTMPAYNVTVRAQFGEEQETFPIAITVVGPGKVTTDPSEVAAKGTMVTVIAAPDDWCELEEGSLKVEKTGSVGAITLTDGKFEMPDEGVRVTAKFVGKPFKVTFQTEGYGEVSLVKGDSDRVRFKERVKLKVKLSKGAELKSLTVTEEAEGNKPVKVEEDKESGEWAFTMPSCDVTVKAVIEGGTPSLVSEMLAGTSVLENPFADYVELVGAEAVQRYELYGSTGQMVSSAGNLGNASLRIETSHLRSGLYLLHLYASDGVKTIRLIKR